MKWEDNVRKAAPYIPGEQPQKKNIIKLNTNECPYPPSPMVEKKMKELAYEDLRLYPEFPEETPLAQLLADYYHVKKEQIFIGVGSDDVLSMAFLTFFHSDKPVFFPDITYSFYDVWAKLYRIPYEVKPLDENFRIRKEDYMGVNGGVIFPNPNAPTGILMEVDAIEEIIRANPDSMVIVDEAYIDFGGTSCLPLLPKYENLLIVRTFSKSRAMAGCRIGYAIGNEKAIAYLNSAKYAVNSYTMNRPALQLGAEAVKDDAYFKEICAKIMATRERTKKELTALGFTFPEPGGNFIFASHKSVKAQEIFEKLKERDIYVRHWNKERIDNYLRITIGTDEQMDALLAALKEII
ncbi:MAG: histidinol-phosphate transaminase [Bacillus sp. (in: Bacteria)]|nr:histidinol-phosphate transaminase [Bacillus sp. (in: firmicutes)]MCM1426867.1 histidinol-phosphate transaminase [Eubacterium sp.]